MTEDRMAEAAAESIGLENAITWEKAIKMLALLMILVAANIIGAGGMSMTVDELVGWFDQYQEEAKQRSSDSNGNLDPLGQGAENDIWYHLGILLYSWLQLGLIVLFGHLFPVILMGYD